MILLFYKNVFGKEYLFKWYNNVQILDSMDFDDKSKYQLTLAAGSWEDNERNYGVLKCLGPVNINQKERQT